MKTFNLCLNQVVILLFISSLSYAQSQEYKFSEAYIKGLGYRYELEMKAESDYSEAIGDVSKMNIASMRSAQRGILKLREAINILIPYNKSKSSNIREATKDVITCYTQILDNYNNSLSALEDLVNATSGNDQNIDIGKISRIVSEITVKQEYISETLFQLTAFVAMVLIDTIPDENNHTSFLLITSKEREDLLLELESYFDKSLLTNKIDNPKYTVASAILLNKILTDKHKSRDERIK